MAVKPSPPPFDPNQKPKPSTGNANDTAKPKPKPGPMPPSIDPPQRPPSQTGFDYERWKASRPQTRVIMPGQGQGPMPIGTRPLPPPVVKDARGDLGGGLMGGGQVLPNEMGRIYGNGDPMAPKGGNMLNPMQGYPGQGGMGRGGQYDPSRDFKGPPGQGGQQIPPGPGSPLTYGDGKSQYPGQVGVGNGPKMGGWNNQLVEGTPEYGDWMRRMNERNGGAPPSGGKPAQGAPPPQDPGMGGQRPPRPNRPPQGRPPVNPQQMQQGAQELYNDNTIPHEFKGQLMQAAQSGDPQAFNEMLFNSGLPQETKMRLQQMFGYGGQGGAPTQSATPDQAMQQVQGQDPYNSQGSPYYGAF